MSKHSKMILLPNPNTPILLASLNHKTYEAQLHSHTRGGRENAQRTTFFIRGASVCVAGRVKGGRGGKAIK